MLRFFNIPCGAALGALSPLLFGGAIVHAQTAGSPPQKGTWSATGTLLEACTCAPPCSCNFGEPPSPHPYCHAVFAYRLNKANYDGVDLSGLIAAAADGPNGESAFIDSRATPAQKPALQKMARLLLAQGGAANTTTRFTSAVLTHEVKGNHLRLAIGQNGGFEADVIIGRDGKTPVVVENNTVWPMFRATKGKPATFQYKDATAGSISTQNSNANYGAFSFGGTVSSASAAKRSAAPVRVASAKTGHEHVGSGKGCCAKK